MPLSLEGKYRQYLLKHQRKQNRGANGTRDSERQKVYNAEYRFCCQYRDHLNSFKEAQKFFKKVITSKTFLDNMASYRVLSTVMSSNNFKLEEANYTRYGGKTNGWTVWLQKGNYSKHTILHELAHCMGHMHHGRSFRQAELKLISRFMGTAAAKALKAEYKKEKLAFGNAREPQSFETWVASKKRMEKMRNKQDELLLEELAA